jgi:Transposase DDE domain
MSVILENLPCLLQDLFLRVPDLVDAQLDVPFCQRQRSLSPSSFVRALVFGWLADPNASVADLADYATSLGSPVSESGLRQRFNPSAVALLDGVLQEALQPLLFGQRAAGDLVQRFPAVGLFDSSIVSLPACLAALVPGCGNQNAGNACCKLLLGLELGSGGLLQLELFSGRQPDQGLTPCCQPLPQGALLIRDLGFFALEDLACQDKAGVYYLSRAQPQLVIQVADGQSQTLMQFVRDKGAVVDAWVEVGTKNKLCCRLIAWRVPDPVAERRRAKRLEHHRCRQRRRDRKRRRGGKVSKGQGKGRTKGRAAPTQEQLEQCNWVVVLTNVPAEKMSVKEAEALLRSRWQIEVLIKVWKQSGRLERIKGKRAERVVCELLAKRLGQVVAHWTLLSSGVVYLEVNGMAATRKVKKYAERLGQALAESLEVLQQLWQQLQQRLKRTPKRRRGQKQPSTAQRLDGQEPPLWYDYAA